MTSPTASPGDDQPGVPEPGIPQPDVDQPGASQPASISRAKAAARSLVRRARRNQHAAVRAALDDALCLTAQKILTEFQSEHGRPARVAAYVPLSGEPGGAGWVPMLADATSETWLPITGAPGTELEWALYTGEASMVAGRMGIREPNGKRHPGRQLAALDYVFVPALGLSRRGVRLGQGGGYYDRTLAQLRAHSPRPRLVGVVFSTELLTEVPHAPHDAVLDAAITPDGYYPFNAE